MKYSFNRPILLPNLKPVEGEGNRTIGQAVSSAIAQSSDNNPIKMWGWCIKLEANEPIDLDKEDTELLKTWVTNTKTLSNLVKAQFLEVFLETKEEKKDGTSD